MEYLGSESKDGQYKYINNAGPSRAWEFVCVCTPKFSVWSYVLLAEGITVLLVVSCFFAESAQFAEKVLLRSGMTLPSFCYYIQRGVGHFPWPLHS